jgi:ligand-binding sensor domain-containing protein
MLIKVNVFVSRLILIAFVLLITGCQTTRQFLTPVIAIRGTTLQPKVTLHTISLVSSSDQNTPWKAFTNIDDVNQIALDWGGNIWTVGRGGISRWDLQSGICDNFTASSGMPGNNVTAFAVGADQKMWFGTYSGRIIEYADNRFSTLDKSAGDTITGLATSPDGTVWIGTNRGIYRYDGKSWQIYSTQQGVLDNYVHSVAVTSNGTVWVGVMGGVSFFDGKNWNSKQLEKGEFISHILEAPDKTIWLTSGNHLIHFDGQFWTSFLPSDSSNYLTAITISPQGDIWLGTRDSGLIEFNEKKLSYIKYPITNISSLTTGLNGNLWLGTYDSGISLFDGQNLDIYKPGDSLSSNFVISSNLSPDGSLWFGTDRGVSRYDGETWQTYTTRDGLVNNHVLSIAASPDGSIWAGTENGVSQFDGNSWKTSISSTGLPGLRIMSIAVTQNGMVWLVSRNSLFQLIGGSWNSVALPDAALNDSVTGIATGTNDNLWVMTTGGVLRFDGNNWLLVQFPGQGSVSSLAISNQGDVWIGLREAGIIFLDGKLWSQFGNENVRSISLDQNGQVHASTDSGDISINGVFWRIYTDADGLASNTIKKIVIGGDGEVWIATNRGISILGAENKWSNFTDQNGLGSNLVQTLVLDNHGDVWAGMPLGGVAHHVPPANP